jgi:hypothetical protein
MGARAANVALGLLLFISAFLWPHRPLHFHSAWFVGTIAVSMALWAMAGARWARLVNVALGGWLIVSVILTSTYSAATLWTHLLVGFGLALFGVSPSLRAVRDREPVTP